MLAGQSFQSLARCDGNAQRVSECRICRQQMGAKHPARRPAHLTATHLSRRCLTVYAPLSPNMPYLRQRYYASGTLSLRESRQGAMR